MRTFATESGKRMIRRLAILLCLSLVIGLIPNALLGAPVTASAAAPEMVTSAQAGVAYKAGLYQGNLGKMLYFTGEMDGNFLAMSDDASEAVDLVLEAGNGGYYLSFTKNGQKSYICYQTYVKNNGKLGCSLSIGATKPSVAAKFNTSWKAFELDFGDASFVLGTYNTFATTSASDVYYITGDKAGDIDVTQFLMHLYPSDNGNQGGNTDATEATKPAAPADKLEVVTAPKAGVAYKIGLAQNNLEKTLYFTGAMVDGKYLETSEDASKAIDVKMEAANGGYYLYFMNGNTKTYICYEEYVKSSGQPGCRLSLSTTAPAVAMTYNSNWNTMVIDFGENDFVLGTYSTYNTISASSTYYITGDKAGDIDVSQFLMRFYAKPAVEEPTTAPTTAPTVAPTTATEPAATEAPVVTEPAATEAPKIEIQQIKNPTTAGTYMAGLVQKNLGKTLYFTGEMNDSGKFLATTEDASQAVDLKMEEAANGGYYLYFMKNGVKNYINYEAYDKSNGQVGCALSLTTAAPAVAMTYSTEWNTFVISFGENDFVLGTYAQWDTISASSTYYITGDKAGDIDNTQFLLHLYAEVIVSGGDNSTTADNTMLITVSTIMVLTMVAAVVMFSKRKFF